MKLRHYKKFQDGGLPKGEKLKIKKYKCKQGELEICEFTVKTKNHTHSKQRHFTMLNIVAKVEGVFLPAPEVFYHLRSAN